MSEDIEVLACALRKVLPPALLAELIRAADPNTVLNDFLHFLREDSSPKAGARDRSSPETP